MPIRAEWVRYWGEGDGTDGTDGTDGIPLRLLNIDHRSWWRRYFRELDGDRAEHGGLWGEGDPLAREAVGITQANVPALPGVTLGITGPDPVVSIPTDLSAKPQAVVVPVNLDPGAYAPRLAGLDSVNLAIAYDTSRRGEEKPALSY